MGGRPIAPGQRDWIRRASCGTGNGRRLKIREQVRSQIVPGYACRLFDLKDFFGRNAAPRPAVQGDSINPERFGGGFLHAAFAAQITEEC